MFLPAGVLSAQSRDAGASSLGGRSLCSGEFAVGTAHLAPSQGALAQALASKAAEPSSAAEDQGSGTGSPRVPEGRATLSSSSVAWVGGGHTNETQPPRMSSFTQYLAEVTSQKIHCKNPLPQPAQHSRSPWCPDSQHHLHVSPSDSLWHVAKSLPLSGLLS